MNRASGVSLIKASVRQEGDDGTLLVQAHFELAKPVPNAGLGLHIETSAGFELCDLRPETTGLRFGDREGTLNLEFELPGLANRLGAGTYLLGLSFHETNWKRCLERTSVGEFVVPASDVYGTGFPPKFEKDGPVVLPVRLRKSV